MDKNQRTVLEWFTKAFSTVVLCATPFAISLAVGFGILFFTDEVPAKDQQAAILIFTSVFGAWLSGFTWAVRRSLELRASEKEKLSEAMYDRLVSRMKPEYMVQLLLEGIENAPPIARWLANEIDTFRQGRADLLQMGRWKISTARMYEAIVETVRGSTKLIILDQDFRRWREALVLPEADHGPNTSTTFNYSRSILHSLAESVTHRGGPDLKRIFVFHESFAPFMANDLALCGDGKWNELADQTKILILIWAVEAKINSMNRGASKLETRLLDVSKIGSKDRDRLIALGDYVIVDSTCCFLEEINYADQDTNTTSEKTTSFVCAMINNDPAKISDRNSLFEDLWSKSNTPVDYGGVLERVMQDKTLQRLVELCV